MLCLLPIRARSARLGDLQAAAATDGVKLGIVDMQARTWHLPTSKNQRDHTIHLSSFALAQLRVLARCREVLRQSASGELTAWLFPATDNRRPVCIKSFGKQLADRQREPDARLTNRSKATTAFGLPGGGGRRTICGAPLPPRWPGAASAATPSPSA